MLRRVALVRTDVSEGLNASFIRVKPTQAGKKYQVFLRSVSRLLVTANVIPSSPILVTMMEALTSFETSVLTRTTRRKITEDAILQEKEESEQESNQQGDGGRKGKGEYGQEQEKKQSKKPKERQRKK
jgi:hypothetical protein